MITTAMILAVEESAPTEWDWLSVEAQLVISTYGLWLATFLAVVIEVYRLVKIERELQILTKMVRAIVRPMRTRRVLARHDERKIIRQAARNGSVPPTPVLLNAEVRRERMARIKINDGNHF